MKGFWEGPASLVDFCAMKTLAVRLLFAVLSMIGLAAGQDVVPLYPGTPPGSAQENYPEKQYFSKVWQEDVVANVTKRSDVDLIERSRNLSEMA